MEMQKKLSLEKLSTRKSKAKGFLTLYSTVQGQARHESCKEFIGEAGAGGLSARGERAEQPRARKTDAKVKVQCCVCASDRRGCGMDGEVGLTHC